MRSEKNLFSKWMKLDDFHNYKDVLVSGVSHDFSSHSHRQIPQQLYKDWATLIIKLAEIVDPAFVLPPLPETLFFQTESIHSDGPYSSNADYYFLDYVSFKLEGENGFGLKIYFEDGRMGVEEPVNIETVGFIGNIFSLIPKQAKLPLANIYIRHNEAQSSAIAEMIALHRKFCLTNFGRWKTKNGTLLIQKNLNKIPFIYGGIRLEGGERFEDSAEYVEMTISGEVIKKYGAAYPFSIEDEMTVSNIHRVIGDCLYEFYYSHRFLYSAPEIKTTLLLDELEIYEDILPFDEKSLFD